MRERRSNIYLNLIKNLNKLNFTSLEKDFYVEVVRVIQENPYVFDIPRPIHPKEFVKLLDLSP